MSDSARRPSKRAIVSIDSDNSANGQPTVKKAAEESASQTALDINHNLIKEDKVKQGANRIAGDAQARVEFLEKLIEKKSAHETDNKLVEELQMKVSSLTMQLEEEKSKANEDRRRYHANVAELRSHRYELASQLTAAGDREQKLVTELQDKIGELTKHRNELARKLAQAGDSEKKLIEELQEKINELTQKLAHYESGQQQHQQPPQPLPAVQQHTTMTSSKKVVKTENDHSTGDSYLVNTGGTKTSPNIFDVHSVEGPNAVVYRTARTALQDVAKKARDSYPRRRYREWTERRKEVFKGEKLHCTHCNKTCENEAIFTHLFSLQHIIKAHLSVPLPRTAYVSRDALEYWMHKLESMEKKPTAAGAVTVAPITVAPAAPTMAEEIGDSGEGLEDAEAEQEEEEEYEEEEFEE